jgi:tetratricopeptide (TPR) repeat protein
VDQTIAETGLAGQSGVSRQVGAVPRRPPGFLPRPALFAQLNQARRQASVVQVITGPPGAGKTQLAASYARAKFEGEWRLVAWVNAGDAASLRAGLAAVAGAAGLSGDGSGQDPTDAGRAVRRLLETDGERRLLVFDDADDPGLVQPFVPVGGAAQVLITTTWPPAADLGTSIRVDPFSAEEALAFLDGRTGLGQAGAAPVVGALGCLPLALAQATGVIARQKLGYKRYLKRLNALRLEAYLRPEQAPPYPQGVAESVVLSLEAVQVYEQIGVSSRVLAILAVLSAAGVRRELLYTTGQTGALASDGHRVPEAEVDRALDGLAERSLLDFSLDGQTVIVHRLVARVVREALARYRGLAPVCRMAASVLEAYADAPAGSRDEPGVTDIPEQVAALADHAARYADASDRQLADAALRLRLLALSHLMERGDNTQAIAVGEQLTAGLEQARGPDHPDTMRSWSKLASAYRKTGQAARAIPLVEQILAARERLLGPEHPITLRARNNLAAAYLQAGRAAEAIPLLEQALAACERLLGADDPRTRATRSNLARAYQQHDSPDSWPAR